MAMCETVAYCVIALFVLRPHTFPSLLHETVLCRFGSKLTQATYRPPKLPPNHPNTIPKDSSARISFPLEMAMVEVQRMKRRKSESLAPFILWLVLICIDT